MTVLVELKLELVELHQYFKVYVKEFQGILQL